MKKRIMLTLTAEPYDELKTVAKSLGLPASLIGQICDEAIARVLPMFKHVQSTGNFTIADLFKSVGEALQEINEVTTQGEVKNAKNTTVDSTSSVPVGKAQQQTKRKKTEAK